MRTTYPMKFA